MTYIIAEPCIGTKDAACVEVCPVDCFYETDDGVVLHSKDLCIGCGYCFYACPFGAPQYPQAGNYGSRGKMDKCTFCAGGPEETHSKAEFQKAASSGDQKWVSHARDGISACDEFLNFEEAQRQNANQGR